MLNSNSVGRAELDLGLNYKAFNKELSGIGPKASSLITNTFGKLGVAAAAAFSAKALFNFGKKAVDLASDLVEVQNVVDVTFGSMSKYVNDFAQTSLTQFGLSELSAKQYTSTMGAMLKSSGLSTKAATKMSIEMSKLTADMASFYNLDTDTAFQKIRSGISGETEPLKQLGINLSVANLEAYALTQGIKKKYQAMSQAEQVLLRYNYLLDRSADSQGDFARNSGTWANQVKILSERGKEFMSLIGQAVMEFGLPVVKFLNRSLELLINITKELGKVYAMITGKQIIAEANSNIGNSADDALDSEIDLSKGIDKAGKSAKKALAPFDELNILQKGLTGGKMGGIGDFDVQLSSDKFTEGLTDMFKSAEDDGNRFYLWWDNLLTKLRNAALIPIPAPVFESLPQPIYNPEWGLTPPMIPLPVFPEIVPQPVYNLDWGLNPPTVPLPVFPKISPIPVYNLRLEDWGLNPPEIPLPTFPEISPIPVYGLTLEDWGLKPPEIPIPIMPALDWTKFHESVAAGKIWAKEKYESMKQDVKEFLGNVVTDFQTHKENMGAITSAIGAVIVANTKSWIKAKVEGIKANLEGIQEGWQSFGSNMAVIAHGIGAGVVGNFGEMFRVLSTGFNNFFSAAGRGIVDWGGGVLTTFGEIGKGIVTNIVNSLKTAFDNFMNFMKATGEKVSGWFSENKEVVLKTAIVGVGGAAAIGITSMIAPAAIPYVLGGLKALAGAKAAGAFAKGGVVSQPTLAMIGEAGKEVVMPLENNTGWITELAYKLAGILGQGGNAQGGNNILIPLTIKIGEDTLIEYLFDLMNREFIANGETTIKV